MLCMTEKLLNSSIKQLLGVSPNTILYGDAIPMEHTLLAEIDTIQSTTAPRTIRDYVDTLMARQGRIISGYFVSAEGKLCELTETIRPLLSRANSKATTQYPWCTTSSGQHHAGGRYHHA